MRIVALVILTLALLICNIFFGAVHIPAGEVIDALTGKNPDDAVLNYIILESRLPQAITALLAGAGLAASGLMLQTLFRNPLAGPSILGITSGASLGVAMVLLAAGGLIGTGAFFTGIATTIGALAGSFLIMGLLLAISGRMRSTLSLLIVGMMTGYLASSMVSLLSSLSNAQSLQNYVMWGMGTFGTVGTAQLPWFGALVIIGLAMAMLLAKPLNLLLMGDNYAANLGVNLKLTRQLILLATGLLSAVITAYCGPIGFIGLAMPHIARLIFRTDDHFTLMPATMLCGAVLALACNMLSVLPEGNIIPINALTPLAGVPVVLYVIMRRKAR